MTTLQRKLTRATLIGLLLCVLQTATAQVPAPSTAEAGAAASDIRHVLDKHLKAIQDKDLPALMQTVTNKQSLTTIFPSGGVIKTRTEYEKLHVDWFKTDDWRMLFRVDDVMTFHDSAIARVYYDSQKKQADGQFVTKTEAILTLVFVKENGEWRLVYDQNTPIKPVKNS